MEPGAAGAFPSPLPHAPNRCSRPVGSSNEAATTRTLRSKGEPTCRDLGEIPRAAEQQGHALTGPPAYRADQGTGSRRAWSPLAFTLALAACGLRGLELLNQLLRVLPMALHDLLIGEVVRVPGLAVAGRWCLSGPSSSAANSVAMSFALGYSLPAGTPRLRWPIISNTGGGSGGRVSDATASAASPPCACHAQPRP